MKMGIDRDQPVDPGRESFSKVYRGYALAGLKAFVLPHVGEIGRD